MRSVGFALLVVTLASGCRTENAHPEQGAEPPRPETAAVAPPAQALAAPIPSATSTTPSAAPAAATASAKRANGDALAVRRLVVATSVERREPVGAATRFTKGEFEKIFAFVEVENRGDPTSLVVSFEPPAGGVERGNVTLDVERSSRWRTWAFSRGVDRPGRWVAVVRTTAGRELARQEFEVAVANDGLPPDPEGRTPRGELGPVQRPGHTAPS